MTSTIASGSAIISSIVTSTSTSLVGIMLVISIVGRAPVFFSVISLRFFIVRWFYGVSLGLCRSFKYNLWFTNSRLRLSFVRFLISNWQPLSWRLDFALNVSSVLLYLLFVRLGYTGAGDWRFDNV